MSRFKTVLVAALVGALACPNTFAGGGITGGSTEITQLLNNAELVSGVAKQAATVSQLAQSYVVQYNTLKEQILAGLKIGNLSLQDVVQIQSNFSNYQDSLKTLGLDLGSFQNTIQLRNTEAQLQNLTLLQYVQRQSSLIANGNAQAAARVQREQALAQQITSDIQLVRQYQAQIPATEGIHASTQLMNGQMNLLLQQMTRLVQLTSEAQGSDRAAAIAKEANDRQTARSIAEQIISNESALRSRNQQVIDGMRVGQ